MKMQITLFTGVIETKFENPQKGLETRLKNLFLFFRLYQNSQNCGQNAKGTLFQSLNKKIHQLLFYFSASAHVLVHNIS